MKAVTIIGARPQFIKAAVVSRELRKKHEEIFIHTGQHYDYNMSGIFFKELNIPEPEYNLGISGGTHGHMTGKMLMAIEDVLMHESPDVVILYGDTNSTMAGALAGVKLGIPIVHIESGNRLGTLKNPEEVNRIVTDHVSSLKLCCTESAYAFLKVEGIAKDAYVVGDPMFDAFRYYSAKVGDSIPERLVDISGNEIDVPDFYYYLTCHRQENTANINTLKEILSAMNELDGKCIYPVHPRNREKAVRILEEEALPNIILCNPVGYLMSVYLVNHCKKVITDSGGLQREAFFAEKQCVTVFDHVVWPETMVDNRNQLSKPEKDEILNKLSKEQNVSPNNAFGDGCSAYKIVNYIEKYFA